MQPADLGFGPLFQRVHDAVIAVDAATGEILIWNPAAEAIFGYTAAEVVGRNVELLAPPELKAAHGAGLARYHASGQGRLIEGGVPFETQALRKDGARIAVELTLAPAAPSAGAAPAAQRLVVALIRDISERQHAVRERAERLIEHAARLEAEAAERRLTNILESMSDAFFAVDPQWRVTYLNAQAGLLLGRERAELTGRNIWEACPELRRLTLYQETRRAMLQNTAVRFEECLPPDDAWFDVHAYPSPEGLSVYLLDITERRHAEEELQHLALHDALTGLPNRSLLLDRLDQAIATAQRQGDTLALLFLDLDRFKEVNDTFGHHAGDLLLQEVARRAPAALRESDTVARLGGDEFAILLPEARGATATVVAEKLLSALGRPFTIDGYRLDLGGSVGIALFPDHATDSVNLMRYADIAMYAAKRGGGGMALYTPDTDRHNPGRLALLSDLRLALQRNELVLHYQPVVRFATGQATRVEALVRWQHPRYNLLAPDEFIPLAERTGLINALTYWVLDEAMRQCQEWRGQGITPDLAVNLSARNLHDPDLPKTIRTLLERYELPAASLKLELTESSIMADPDAALAVLHELRGIGVRIAIDDFGTGYSSLSYLRRLPVDEIKIDKSFVLDMAVNENDAVIVRSAIELAHNLGLQVVAEGVEDAETWERLAQLGCDAGQAFYVAKPMPGAEMGRWLQLPRPRPTLGIRD